MMIWTTQDGRKIPIQQMETSHIRSCIVMLRSQGNVTISEMLDACKYTCSSHHGEYASMAVQNEVASMKPSRKLELLELELKRRAH